MDLRETVVDRQSFVQVLQALMTENRKAFLLYEENGLNRAEGFITALQPTDAGVAVTLNNNTIITVESITAINGIFLSDYCTC